MHAATPLSGLDPADQLFVGTLVGSFKQYLALWFGETNASSPERESLPAILRACATPARSLRASEDRETWRARLYQLAEHLNLTTEVHRDALHLCISRGYFSPRLTRLNLESAHDVRDEVVSAIAETFAAIPLADVHVRQLVSRGVYRDEPAARKDLLAQRVAQLVERGCGQDLRTDGNVAYELQEDRLRDRAIERARRMLLRYLDEEPIWLLRDSPSPFATAVLHLEQRRSVLTKGSDDADSLMATLRSQVIALQRSLTSVGAWNENLLSLPVGHSERNAYRQRTGAERLGVAAALLAQLQEGNSEQAMTLLTTLIDSGADGLAARLKAIPITDQILTEYRAILDRDLGVVVPNGRREIERIVRAFHIASRELAVDIPLTVILNEHPEHIERRKLRNRLRYKDEPAPPDDGSVSETATPKSRKAPLQNAPPLFVGPVIKSAAKIADISEDDATKRFREATFAGALGFYRRQDWEEVIDERLREHFYLLRLGPLEGRLSWQQIADRINACWAPYGLPTLSAQVSGALSRLLHLPGLWHDGEGRATAMVRHRQTLVMQGVPMLHGEWTFYTVRVPGITIIDGRRRKIADILTVILVFDRASQCPMGCWCVGGEEINAEDLGMALFYAIWHPYALDFPLHGTPATLQVPRTLAKNDLTSMRQAAAFFATEIEIGRDEIRWEELDVVQYLRLYGAQILRTRIGHDTGTVPQAQDALMKWLSSIELWNQQHPEKSAGCFPHHQIGPIPPAIRSNHVTMPGSTLPAAGWLLPHAGVATTIRDGVNVGDVAYRSSFFRCSPGNELPYRALPSNGRRVSRGVFVIDGLFSVGIPGFYIEDEGWSALTAAQNKDELLDFSDAVLEVDKYVKDWNNKVLANGKPRAQVYSEHPRVKTISIPPERLALLASADDWALATISDLGILYKKVYYKLHIASEADYIRWSNAAGNELPVPICIIHTSEGRLVLACFDGVTWEYVFPVSEQRISPKKRFAYVKAAENAKRDELQKRVDAFLKLLDEKLGGVPTFQHGQAILPPPASSPEQPSAPGSGAIPTQGERQPAPAENASIPGESQDTSANVAADLATGGTSTEQAAGADQQPPRTETPISTTDASGAPASTLQASQKTKAKPTTPRAKQSEPGAPKGKGKPKTPSASQNMAGEIPTPAPEPEAPRSTDTISTPADQPPRISSAERMRQLREEQARKRQSNQ